MFWLEQLLPHSLIELIVTMAIVLGWLAVILWLLPWTRQMILIQFNFQRNIWRLLWTSFIILIIPLYILSYAYWVEPNLVEVNYSKYDIENLSIAQPIRIVVIGDLQAKGYLTPSYSQYISSTVNSYQPDMVMWVGDLVEENPEELNYMQGLKQITARFGKFAVMGNHDYGERPRGGQPDTELALSVNEFWKDAGFQVLKNQVAEESIYGQRIAIAGGDSSWYNLFQPSLITSELKKNNSDFALFVTHEPDDILEFAPNTFSLGLAGHCHGGQISFGFIDKFIGLPVVPTGCRSVKLEPTNYQDVNGNKLFITKGIGTTSFRMRFGVRPEIAVIDLL